MNEKLTPTLTTFSNAKSGLVAICEDGSVWKKGSKDILVVGDKMAMWIYCCECKAEVPAVLTNGAKVYPHRDDLRDLPFWMCEACFNFVGCHHKTKDRTKPLGNIPTGEIKHARRLIHIILDPLWQHHPEKFRARAWIYRWLSSNIGKQYHTAEIATIEEARAVYALVKSIKNVEDCRNAE